MESKAASTRAIQLSFQWFQRGFSLFKSFDCAQVAQLHAELHVEHSVLPEISAVTMAPFWLVTVPHQHLGFRSKRIEHDRTPEPRVNICVGPNSWPQVQMRLNAVRTKHLPKQRQVVARLW